MINRRFFIGGALAFGAFGGCRVLAAVPGFRAGEKPRLRFGVVSDVHLRLGEYGKGFFPGYDTETFERTLEYFRDQGVDAVMIAGDIADRGFTDELEAAVATWRKVFPNDRTPDGRRVEKLFVTGNHDWEGAVYRSFGAGSDKLNYGEKAFPDKAERVRHTLSADYAGNWRRILEEDFAPVFRKEVCGYAFVGAHWTADKCRVADTVGVRGVGEFFARHGKSFDPKRPLFFFQHPHPRDTVYGDWAWGRDVGESTRALSAFPNAVAFSGHSHYPLTDERSIWQGAFTSLGTASLRYTVGGYSTRLPYGYENSTTDNESYWRYDAEKMMPKFDGYDCRQGLLVSVYDDCIVYVKREFVQGREIGEPWVQPLPSAESKPFAFVEHAKKFGAPQFAEGAALEVKRVRARNRGCTSARHPVPAEERPSFEVVIPPANAAADARSYEFEVRAESKYGTVLKAKYVFASGFNHAPGTPKTLLPTSCVFSEDEIRGVVAFSVKPVSCFGKIGRTLRVSI